MKPLQYAAFVFSGEALQYSKIFSQKPRFEHLIPNLTWNHMLTVSFYPVSSPSEATKMTSPFTFPELGEAH